jgi:ABC-type sugar transport system ATPase subunit
VLHGVNFTVEPGEIHALIGHNGAGKSTLMKVLGGVYPEFTGAISIDGADAASASPKEAIDNGIAVIYQDFALIPDLDVAHNIALGREPGTAGLVGHGDIYARSEAEARRYGITLPMRATVRSLGVAQQQLIEIVRALARNARVLVMDEPTARLAPPEREQLFQVMRDLATQGVGMVFISHFLDEVIAVSDRITVLRDGAVVTTAATSSFTTSDLASALVGDGERKAREADLGRKIGEPRLVAEGLSPHGARPSDITVRAGEIVALAGLVGSGRTSLARAIVGDLKSAGRVTVDSRRVPRNPVGAAAAGVVMVPEDRKRNGLVMTSTVLENIELTGLGRTFSRFGLVRRGRVAHVARDTITRLGVRPADPHKTVDALSGGNAQKVLVGRAIATGAKAVVLDQPTAGVDIGAKADLHGEVRTIAAGGTAVIVISDDLDEMLELADRVLIVVNGSVIGENAASELNRAVLLESISKSAEAAA